MRRAVWVLLLAGLFLQLVFVVRAWRAWPSYPFMPGNIVARDSLQFRDLIVPFLEAPRFQPSWKKSGTGTDIPGSFLPFLWGTPALVTHDVRSAVLIVVLFHGAAGLLLVKTLCGAFGDRFTAIFLAVFWLSPWRLFHSGFIWEPNLLILAAAAHLWACWTVRESTNRPASAVLGATLVLTLQVHFSAIFLILLTGLLLLKKALRISWAPFLAGAAAGGLPLVPAALAFVQGRSLNFSSDLGFPGRGFLYVLPVFRGLQLWLRMGSLDVGRMYAGDSVSCASVLAGGTTVDALRCSASRAGGFLASASVLIAVVAGWWWLRRTREPARPAAEQWLGVYTLCALAALLVGAGLAPITLQTWHVVIAAPVACLPLAAWINASWPFERRSTRALVALFLIARLPLAGLLAFEYPAFCLVPEAVARAVQD
jgi:hypothetical protein